MPTFRGSRRVSGPHHWRGGRGDSRSYQRPRGISTTEASPPPLGDIIEVIRKSSLSSNDSDTYYGITDVASVASYNWINHPTPRIMIPGKPPLWSPPQGPQQLRQDDGIYYRDRNAAGYGDHPMEAAVVSVMQMLPQPSDRNVDVLACGNTIGNLLRFIRGEEKPFRMLVEVVGNTVHFIRRENSPKEQITDVRGYGHTFPEAYTMWEQDVKRSTSHQRILNYQFDGLSMMVRFEGDGYVKPASKTLSEASASKSKKMMTEQHETSLLDDLAALGVQATSGSSASGGLEVVDGGDLVAQDTIFDLKTRSIRHQDRDILGEEMPRLWISQIPKFILAFHTSGCFEDVEVQDIRDQVQAWESDHQADLARLAKLLHHIIDSRLRESDDIKWELVRHEASETLEIRKRLSDAGTPFSDKVHREWAEWLNGSGNAGERGGDDFASDDVHSRSSDDSDFGSKDFTACDKECGYCGRCEY